MKLERICYWILIFVLGGLLLWKWNCSGQKPCPTITEKTETKTVTSKDSASVDNPAPVKVSKYIPRPKIRVYDSFNMGTVPSDSMIWNDNIQTTPMPDTESGDTVWYENNYSFKYADITVQDQVQGGSLLHQKIIPKWKVVETTKYITQTDTVYKPTRKTILYFGLGGYGNKHTYIRGGMADVSLKTRNDKMYTVGRIQHFGINEGYWFGEIKFPIKLKRK